MTSEQVAKETEVLRTILGKMNALGAAIGDLRWCLSVAFAATPSSEAPPGEGDA